MLPPRWPRSLSPSKTGSRNGRTVGGVLALLQCEICGNSGMAMAGLQILLVEDDPFDAEYVERVLHQAVPDCSMQHASHLVSAFELSERIPFDVTFLDLTLPDSRGLDTIARLHRHAPHIPIVVLTGVQDPDLEAEVVDAGAHDFLSKADVNRDSLARCVRYLLDRQAAAELLRKREAELAHLSRRQTISEMASAIVHELTQPVSVISNLATASLNRLTRGEYEQVEDNLRAVVEESSRATDTIQRLRDFFRRGELQKSTVMLGATLREAVRLIERQVRHAGVQLSLELVDADVVVHADAVQIQQVIINLIRNAIDAADQNAPGGSIQLRVEQSDDAVFTIVRDNGHGTGAAPEDLFAPFFTTREKGIGLGLSISRTIVESHGGQITATSNSDQGGMTFRFSLPKPASARNYSTECPLP